MDVPTGLNHVAVSVAAGTLTAEWRTELLEFYGLSSAGARSSRSAFPISVSPSGYVHLRERSEPMVFSGTSISARRFVSRRRRSATAAAQEQQSDGPDAGNMGQWSQTLSRGR